MKSALMLFFAVIFGANAWAEYVEDRAFELNQNKGAFERAASHEVRTRDFLFAIVTTDGIRAVFIGTKGDWDNGKGALSDSYSADEWNVIGPIIDELGLCEIQESTFETCGMPSRKMSDSRLKAALMKAGLSFDPAFQKWLND